jgi:hypothetical protein
VTSAADRFRLSPRQVLLSLGCVGVFWLFLGGERFDCTAATEDSWTCTRRSTVPVWSMLGLDEMDQLNAADVARIAPKASYWRRHGHAFEIQRHDGSRFRLPRQTSAPTAETDRDAFVAFTRAQRGALQLTSPGPWGRRLFAGVVTLLIVGATAWNVPRWWRGDGRGGD